MQTKLQELLQIEHPIIMAPMFLVNNTKMMIAALDSGISAAIPALNYRSDEDFRKALEEVKAASDKAFGVNLIVNKSNIKYKAQLQSCIDKKVDFIITSLGSPQEVIEKCKPHGIKVFCDVVDIKYAQKVVDLGAHALIAVGKEAGGHAGNQSLKNLIPDLKKAFDIPVIAAGGVSRKEDLDELLNLGADGVSVGTVFIASHEAPVSAEYKQALVEYGAKDIVMTSNLSGSPLTVINTPYVQKVGTKAGFFSKLMMKNKKLKKFVKMFVAVKGMKAIEKAAFKSTYKTYWVAGPSIEHIHSIRSIKEIVMSLLKG
ncbi:MAG: 2-nitropropane dioxygenase [Bacteroidetes bacterium 4572_77]|nr:MAG: 2-nitropropane dioxygenase [Bacteroidetes bacterium 4572_77]